MAISGTTNTCQILTNTQFVLSGLSKTNLSTINITDENGLDVSECFGIETKIVTVLGDNVVLSGECDTSLEIKITEGFGNPVECLFVDYEQDQATDLIIVEYADGSTTFNVHPECCESIGFTSEMGPDMYYVCRWRESIDPMDCDNYDSTGEYDSNGYMIFEYAGGGTTNEVPKPSCCYAIGLVEEIVNGIRHCVTDEVPDPCGGLTIVQPVPQIGIIKWLNPVNNSIVTVVPTTECCRVNGHSYQVVTGGYECYNSLTAQKPTVSITNTPCCQEEQVVVPPTCKTWKIYPYDLPSGEGIEVEYVNCSGNIVQEEFYGNNFTSYICVREMISISPGNHGPSPLPPATYYTPFGTVTALNTNC